MIQLITRDDLTVEHGTERYGPTAKVTVNAGHLAGKVFTLRSTELMEHPSRNACVMVYADDGSDRNARDWRGAFETIDMSEAIDKLAAYVNELAVRNAVEESIWSEGAAMDEAWRDFRDALEASSPKDWRAAWGRVRAAVDSIEMKVREVAPEVNRTR